MPGCAKKLSQSAREGDNEFALTEELCIFGKVASPLCAKSVRKTTCPRDQSHGWGPE